MDKMNQPFYFLGPKSENRPLFIESINLIMNDYIFWRRNFHPKDPTALTYAQTQNQVNQDFRENFTNEIFKLLADLKLDPPFFSPRYMAHMISETALPGLIAYIATLMYNPNNVSSEASPVTLKYELEVAKQFAHLFGYDENTTFGHVTGGGTVANYESLFYNINLRTLPISLAMTLKEHKQEVPTHWDLLNTPYEEYDSLLADFKNLMPNYQEYLKNTVAQLGLLGFEKKYYKIFERPLPDFKIIVPASAHYSWSRGVKLLGLGKQNLIKIKLNSDLQIDCSELTKNLNNLNDCLIIQMVAVFGTTEFGNFDQIHEIIKIRNELKKQIYFPIHIDAAYGGYFATISKNREGDTLYNFHKRLTHKIAALKDTESITVDPHKLGYAPYGAGAFLFKHGKLKDFIAENADYCFNPKTLNPVSDIELGKYILEGSKPGASAAAVYFNHKLIPLEYNGYGKILENLNITALHFYQLLLDSSDKNFTFIPLHQPQSNIVTFYIKPYYKDDLNTCNEFTHKVAARFGIKQIDHIQEYDYIVSNTTIDLENLVELPDSIQKLEINSSKLNLVRMVFMNQWHENHNSKDISYLIHFVRTLKNFLEQDLRNNPTD